jgi:hypothetical protein
MPWYPAPARFAAATYRYASSENRCQPIAGEHLAPASRPGTAGRRAYRGGPSDRSAARTVFLEIPSTRATCLTGSLSRSKTGLCWWPVGLPWSGGARAFVDQVAKDRFRRVRCVPTSVTGGGASGSPSGMCWAMP